jgi:hypothetical protein
MQDKVANDNLFLRVEQVHGGCEWKYRKEDLSIGPHCGARNVCRYEARAIEKKGEQGVPEM